MHGNKTIAIYARVSTEEQAIEGFSIEAQLQTIHDYAKQNGYRVLEYVDKGISGKSMDKRPALQKLLSDAKQRLFEEVIVWKIFAYPVP